MKREEIVGKRFLSVSGCAKLKQSKISEWGWRTGVIRASSHRDNNNPELQVLVEYDDVEWHRREWISIYKESAFNVFMVEKDLVWSDRIDPYSSTESSIFWPALSFVALVDLADMKTQLQPVEFLVERELAFRDYTRIEPFLNFDQKFPGSRDHPEMLTAIRRWLEYQDGQRILLTTPSVLVGYRVEVYRAEGTTQWYTAVIVGYNESTKDLTVTDDTVLEEHNEDPSLVQMRLIGDGVVDSIMRGEVVGITPRRSRSSVVLTQQHQHSGSRVSRLSLSRHQTSGVHFNRKQKTGKLSEQESCEKETCDQRSGNAHKARKRRNSDQNEVVNTNHKEDLENKGNKKKTNNRGTKKKILEEANNSKLRDVEDCAESGSKCSVVGGEDKSDTPPGDLLSGENAERNETAVRDSSSGSNENERKAGKEEEDSSGKSETKLLSSDKVKNKKEEEEEIEEKKNRTCQVEEKGLVGVSGSKRTRESESGTKGVEGSRDGQGEAKITRSCCTSGVVLRSSHEDAGPPVITSATECNSVDDDGPLSRSSPFRMDDAAGTAVSRFPDDRSDSGVSSFRSGSGDERSGSRSSALSISDEPQSQLQSTTQPANRSPLFIPANSSQSNEKGNTEPVRVWRDPSLAAEPRVRHVQSVQHQTLLMSHPPPASAPQPPANNTAPSVSQAQQALALAQAQAAHYPPVPPPPLLSPHPLHVPLPPPGLYSQLPEVLWKQRYPPLSVAPHLLGPTHTSAEELLERERAFYQDKDRLLRRDQEIEKHKERERQEREKLERERERQEREKKEREERERKEQQRITEQAVHKHFEESLRLAAQTKKWNMNIINSLPPPAAAAAAREEERKRADEQHQALQQQRILVERQRHDRERFYTAPTRPPSNPTKLEYPPPAHSRPGSVKPAEKPVAHAHTALPKAEPNFSLFGYPNYPPVGLTHDKGRPEVVKPHRPSDVVRDLPNPPPLTADLKSSVIVKNEGKNSHQSDIKNQTHSPKPQSYITATPNAHKPASAYDYRGSTQPAHPLPHHHIEPQKHHRPIAHNLHHHQQPPPPPQQQPPPQQRQSPHLSATDQRFMPGAYSSKPATVGSYPYPTPPVTAHYSMTASVSSSSKPKVSSPAPPHIYGKPTAGITTGIPVCRTQDLPAAPLPLTSKASPSPYQQVPLHQPPSSSPVAGGPPPPPAHSSRTSTVLDSRLYPGPPPGIVSGLAVKPPPQHLGTSPPTATAAPHPASRSSPLQVSPVLHNHASTFQTQPLDLGVSERSISPKRKGPPMPIAPIDAAKKRRNESPQQMLLEVPSATHGQPLLSRVSEPSPLVAGAATTITTVVNTAAYISPTNLGFTPHSDVATATSSVTITPVQTPARTNSADSTRPSSTGSSGVPSVFAPQARASPACSSPGLSTGTPVKVVPTSADSDKSNSPGPIKASAYPVHKLKKAWLERHSGEDGTEDTEGVVGSGTCVTLPITLDRGRTTPTITNTVKEGVSCGLPNAVNSISKSKSSNTGKASRSKSNKETALLNGHVDVSKSSHPDDSSSSDQETRKSPAKRKAKVKKKKKGGKRNAAEENKKKKVVATPVQSESSDSDKDSGSEKDSDSGGSGANLGSSGGGGSSTGSKRTGSANHSSSGAGKEPKKRGRRPKGSKNERDEEPRSKKSRDDPPVPSRDPFRKPPVSQLKKTGESFLQDGPCFEVAPKLGKCRECRWTPNQRSKNMPNIFCRFYAFRKLRYTKNGQLAIAGFSDPHTDPSEEDMKLWLPSPDKPPSDLDLVMSRFLLQQVGDQFCDLLKQEKEAVSIHMSEDKTIAWKRVVQGVREMCDVCETTLFNFHWACGKCGFVVCLDCYKGRKNGTVKVWGEPGRDRDDFSWLQCTNRQAHEQEKLMLTQIIAGDSLMNLGRKLHEIRSLYNISQYCDCPMSKELKSNGISKDLLKNIIKTETINGIRSDKKETEKESKGKGNGTSGGSSGNGAGAATNGSTVKTEGSKTSPSNWLPDSGGDDKKKSDDLSSMSDSDSDKEGNYSTLRELLIRPSHKPNGGSNGSPPQSPQSEKKKPKNENIDELISSAIEKSMAEMNEERDSIMASPEKGPELKHFVRLNIHKWTERGDSMTLPRRVMTLAESKQLYPGVPHSWLCDGKLLRLNDPTCPNNYKIFQDQWKRGQPVIVRDVSKNLDMSLWHPDSFADDFGDDKNDLINCMTGKIVPNQPMRKFWEGFEHFSKRLKDERGNPMLLKLKDWPPGEDFAEMLPSRFNDLMKVLPLSEYTHRNGRLNLASRLPECFVRPDLGPKMYNAYGSALHPDKGTTNLHLDISDAVNVMVYVGIPKDGDNEEHIKEAFRAIDEAGCDILTRRRVREKGEFPGALWHIYNARDADKIRDLLNKVAIERGARLEPHHDPIHDQDWYLDGPLRVRLYEEYGIEGYAIVQCLGDAVFIPAGAPHQVRNLHNCMKVAEDFVSPENVSHCFHMTQEFRDLSDKHLNHEDKLQIKNIIYHAVKDSLSVLMGVKDQMKEEKTVKKEPREGEEEEEEENDEEDEEEEKDAGGKGKSQGQQQQAQSPSHQQQQQSSSKTGKRRSGRRGEDNEEEEEEDAEEEAEGEEENEEDDEKNEKREGNGRGGGGGGKGTGKRR